MNAAFGPVLTHSPSLDAFIEYLQRGRFSTAKVITGWGLERAWTPADRCRLICAVPNLIVRTVNGDPSLGRHYQYLLPGEVAQELHPWLVLKPDLWIELGNEPDVLWDVPVPVEDEIWRYRWWLQATRDYLRTHYPQARLIAPSPRIGAVPQWERWLEIPAETLRSFDAVSLHLYGWHQIVNDGKRELADAQAAYSRLLPSVPVIVSEMGIHNPQMNPAHKLALYRRFAEQVPLHWLQVLFYHHNAQGDLHPEYHIASEDISL
jgi:hypothetical protein